MGVDVGTATGYLDLDISGFLAGLRSAQSEAQKMTQNMATQIGNGFKGVGQSLTSAGSTLTKGITVPLAGVGVAAFKVSSDFESAMAKVNTIADTSKKSIGDIKNEVVDLSNQTGMAASELAEAVYQAMSAGVDTADAVNFVADATKLAEAGFTDTTTAVDALTTIINAYGLSAEDAAHISDVLISTQNKGKTTVNELAATIGKIIPTANAMGVSLEDLGVAYSFLTAGGIATAESTTYLNGMFNELGKSGTDVSDILKERTGKSFQELMNDGASLREVLGILEEEAEETGVGFNDLWSSQEAGKAALSLLNTSTEEYNETLKDFQTTVGDTEEAYGIMAETTDHKLKVALQNGKNALMQLGDTLKEMLLPFIEKCVELLKKLNDWLSGLSEQEKEQIVKIAAVVAAIGPALLVLGKLVTGVGNVITTFGKIPGMIDKLKTGFGLLKGAIAGINAPIVAIVAVIATLVAAFTHLWETNEEFREKITAIWDGIKSKFEEFAQGIVDRLNALGFDFENITEVLSAIWNGFCELLAPVFEAAFQIISDVFGGVLDVITGILDIFIGLFTGNWEQLWNGVKEVFSGVWDAIKGVFSGALDALKGIADVILGWFGTSWEELWQGVKDFFVGIWEGIKSFFEGVVTGIKTTASNAWNAIKSTVDSVWNAIKTIIENVMNGIKTVVTNVWDAIKNTISTVVNGIKSTINTVWEAIKTIITNVMNAIKTTVTNVWNAIKTTVSTVVEGIKNTINTVFNAIKTIIDTVMNGIKTVITNVWDAIKTTVSNVVNGIKSTIETVFNAIQTTVSNIVNSIKTTVSNVFDAMKTAITGTVDNIKTSITNTFNNIKTSLTGIVESIKSSVSQTFENMKTAMSNAMDNAKTLVTDAITNAKNSIVNVWDGITDTMADIGKNIIQGIIDGIGGMVSSLYESIKNALSGLVDKAKDVLGIESPSKVMRDQIGKWMPPGIAVGFESAMSKATKDMQKSLNNGIDSLEAKDVSVGVQNNMVAVASSIADYFESIETRLANSVANMKSSLEYLIEAGTAAANGVSVGYVGYGGFTKSDNVGKDEPDNNDTPKNGGGNTYVFYTSKPIDEIEAARKMKETERDLAEGFA